MKIIAAILIFSIIVLFHEFGHFTIARACGVIVDEFSLGMGPRLLSRVSRKSGTRYSVKVLPFGGSCLMRGEDTEDMSEGSFGSKKVWQRLLIVAAGPLFNFILAFMFAAVIIASVGYDAPAAEWVAEGGPLEQAGLEVGDTIVSIGGKRMHIYRDITNYIQFHQEKLSRREPVAVIWEHEGERRSAEVTPVLNKSGTKYILGLYGGGRFSAHGNPLTIASYSLYEVRYWIGTTLSSLAMIGRGEVSLDDVSGPVGVAQVIGDTYEETKSEGAFMLFLNMLNLAILLSANLGVMNLLPFPALDGGRIILLLLEAVRGRKLGRNAEGYINLAGFAVLMSLMVVVLFNDIRKLF